tara:strand:+ start:428 stop:862 length:435 start_codon:yes stop_codon:yes gene_type:complete
MSGEAENSNPESEIRKELSIQYLLSRMPKEVADQFTDDQLIHLKTAIGARNWGNHPFDARGTITLPGYRFKFYYVLIFGKNRRNLSRSEEQASNLLGFLLSAFLVLILAAVLLITLYLLKSFAGIDLFPNFSIGLWDYFKDSFS